MLLGKSYLDSVYFLTRSSRSRSIKTILEALSEEYQPNESELTTPIDAAPDSALRTLRRIRLSLSPLFLIENNLLKLLAPGCADCRRMFVRAGTSWRMILHEKATRAAVATHGSPAERRASSQ